MNERVYLDWAAATPLLPEAQHAMVPYLSDIYGNPSAIHAEGQRARDAIESARVQAARVLQVRPSSVTWTGSGTEANNIAILGHIEKLRSNGQAYSDMEVVTTAIEHSSAGKTVELLLRRGVTVHHVAVQETGVIDLAHLRSLVNERTVLFTTHYSNSEIGTIQPTRQLKKVLCEQATQAVLHIDAAQAPLWLDCQFDVVGADIMTLDAGKCCGPKGVGILVRRPSLELSPVLFGGGQEDGLRPGTENVAGVVGAAVALEWAQGDGVWRGRAEHVRATRNQAVKELLKTIPMAALNGAPVGDDCRIANNINISIPSLDTEFATVVLDTHGFAVSTKSACSGAGGGESAVVFAISDDYDRAKSTLRITLGPDTTSQELERLVATLKVHVEKMKQY